jgi:arylsulfatase A-like enzyme
MDNKQACYASLCEGVDASLGKIMDYLDEKGVADNTIIILYADNGGHSANTAKGGIAHTQNAPLREGKSSVYEGGVRVPMLVYWPGKTRAGIRINTPVMAEDFFPTILEMAETKKYSVPQEIDGESWVKLVTKGAKYTEKAIRKGKITDQKEANRFVVPKSVSGLDPERAVVSHFPHQWRIEDQDDIDFMSAVRAGPWKLVYRMHNYVPMVDAGTHGIKAAIDAGALELYNLDSDISERRNIASVNEAIVTRLSVILSEKLRSWNAPMPICRKTGRTVPLPDEL